MIAVGATDAEGNFAIQLTAGQATAQQSLLAIATDGAGHYSGYNLHDTSRPNESWRRQW